MKPGVQDVTPARSRLRPIHQAVEVHLHSRAKFELWLRWLHHAWHYPEPSADELKEIEWAQGHVFDAIERSCKVERLRAA